MPWRSRYTRRTRLCRRGGRLAAKRRERSVTPVAMADARSAIPPTAQQRSTIASSMLHMLGCSWRHVLVKKI